MRKVPVHWEELETAFERNGPDTESFLDLATGNVVTIADGAPDANELRSRVAARASQFERVDPASSREQYRWMEKFVGSVADGPLRERLIMAIDGKGAFRRFKDVLLNFPVERERWFTYRSDLLHYHMQEWLRDHDLESTVPAPWGEVGPPPELDTPLPRPALSAENPGEVLRRQARDLIEGLAALDLPAAIAFLTFLQERGSGVLSQGREAARSPARVHDFYDVPAKAGGAGDGDAEEDDHDAPRALGAVK